MNSDRRIFSPKKQIQALRHNGHRAKKERKIRRKQRTINETCSSPASSGLDLRIQSQTSWRNSALSDVMWHPIKKNHFLVCTEGIFSVCFLRALSLHCALSFFRHTPPSWRRFLNKSIFYESAENGIPRERPLTQSGCDRLKVSLHTIAEEGVLMSA